jgi:hypothetical protein
LVGFFVGRPCVDALEREAAQEFENHIINVTAKGEEAPEVD